jgi:hypothetical protein
VRTRFQLAACTAVLLVSAAAAAAEDVAPPTSDPRLILLHEQRARPGVQTSPEQARAQVLATERTLARRLYAQFFTDLSLAESQIDALTDLIAEHSTLTTAWSTGEVDFTPKKEDRQLAGAVRSQMELLLGPAGFQKFEEYQDTLGERFELSRLVRLLVVVGHPLTGEQMSRLVSIMKSERSLRRSLPAAAPDTLEYAEDLTRRRDEFDLLIKPRFDALLSAEQREFAERYFAARAERRRNALDSYRNMLATGARVAFTYPPD